MKLAKGAAVPAAAREAIELCGRLPLCLSVAGAMIAEHADDWQTWLVPALKEGHGAELRERILAAVGEQHLPQRRGMGRRCGGCCQRNLYLLAGV